MIIQIKDGKPFEHPIYPDNFVLAFPDIDINNLPPDRFARVMLANYPILADDEKFDDPELSYDLIEGVVYQKYNVVKLTEQEIAARDAKRAADHLANELETFPKRIAAQKERANFIISGLSNTEGIALWNQYLVKLDEMDVNDPLNAVWPMHPRVLTELNVSGGSGTYNKLEFVYQSEDGVFAHASAKALIALVQDWDVWTGDCTKVIVTSSWGTFKPNQVLIGKDSGASYTITSVGSTEWYLPTA